jgi:hypothetical protein
MTAPVTVHCPSCGALAAVIRAPDGGPVELEALPSGPAEALELAVARILGSEPRITAEEVFRRVGGRRAAVFDAVKRLRSAPAVRQQRTIDFEKLAKRRFVLELEPPSFDGDGC